MLTEELVFNKYGGLLTLEDLEQVVRKTVGTIRNEISEGTFDIPTSKRKGVRVAHFRDVAKWIDKYEAQGGAAS